MTPADTAPDLKLTPPDLGELAVELRVAVMRTARVLRNQAVTDAVSPGQTTVLGLLAKRGPQTMRQLAEAERVQAPSMTRTVNALSAQNLVERTESPSDGRQVVVTLTDAGRVVVDESRRARSAWLAERLEGLSDADRTSIHRAAEILLEMCAR